MSACQTDDPVLPLGLYLGSAHVVDSKFGPITLKAACLLESLGEDECLGVVDHFPRQ